ncbi:TetR family transcriptional regulator [Nocardia sp. NPDC004568]|uniref:TetR/AcrR family transcriptional regulator n=1 Tax=Nocardia sp. NPDC004568 TaxID=3154551 RepID=UPI0033A22C66
MARTKSKTDAQVLDDGLALAMRSGLPAITFAALAQRCGLSPATLVQRFSTKDELKRRILLHAWDRLDEATAELDTTVPRTPEGAIELLIELSAQYEDREAYPHGLLLLREDVLDPHLRRRGVAWEAGLVAALGSRLGTGEEGGAVLAAYWQGVICWWAFHDDEPLVEHLARKLGILLDLVRAGSLGGCTSSAAT